MILARRIIPFIAALLLAGAFEIVIFFPDAWKFALAAILIVVILSSWILQKKRLPNAGFMIGLVALNGGAFMVLVVLQNAILNHVLIATTVLITAIFLEQLFTFHFLPDRYRPHALEHVSLPLNLLAVFLIGTGLSAQWALLHYAPIYLSLGFFAIAFFLSWQYFWVSKVPLKRARWGVLFSAVLVAQLFWVMSFLPLSFYVVGVLIVALYYLTLNITRFSTLDSLGSNIVKRTVILVAVAVISVLVTAQWV